MWNVPLKIIKNIKQIISVAGLFDKMPMDYTKWVKVLSNCELENNEDIHSLLDNSFDILKDTKIDYHIMGMEGLLSGEMLNEEGIPLTVKEKMIKVYSTLDFESIKTDYLTDINKKKKLLLECIRYVAVDQMGSFVLLKYRPEVTYYDLWNEFYLESRGLVLDIDEMRLVSVPYRKFFNLNENFISSFDRVVSLIQKASNIAIKNKEDGSMVSVSAYNGTYVVTTPGSFTSKQVEWAKQFLESHYSLFIAEIPDDLTFIFEAIYPENRIVVDYKEKEALILTNIRSKETGRLLPEEEVSDYVKKYGFLVPYKETKTLYQLLEEAKDIEKYPATEKEGWVFVVNTLEEQLLFKLKCSDYCEMHKIIGYASSPKVIFKYIKGENFDDFISNVPDVFKPIALRIANIIWDYMRTVETDIKTYTDSVPIDLIFSDYEIENHSKFEDYLKEIAIPSLSSKLAKTVKAEIEVALVGKSQGKEISLDKWAMKEFTPIWDAIPVELKDQKVYRSKQGKLLGYIKKTVPAKYQGLVLNYAMSQPYDYKDVLVFDDIDFSVIQSSLSTYSDEE